MALAIVGTPVVTNGIGSGFGSIVRPTGTASGNLLLVFVACDGGATGGTIGVPAASSGGSDWTTLFTAQHPTLDGQWLHGFKHVIEASDAPGGYSFSSFNISNGNDYSQVVVEVSGQDSTTPIDATAVVVTNSSANASPVSVNVSAGITTATNNALVFYVGAGDPAASNSNSWSGPSGYTSDGSVGANYAPLQVSHKEQTTAGATGAVSATLTLTSGNAGFAGALVAIRPASGGAGSAALGGSSVTGGSGSAGNTHAVAL